jgi:hypothetical protein
MASCLQTIASNNLLSYEQLTTLKTNYDQWQDEFLENLRLIDEYIHDLRRDHDVWTQFNDELKRLEIFFRDVGTSFDTAIMTGKPLNERQMILEVNKMKIIHGNTSIDHKRLSSVFVRKSNNNRSLKHH